MRVLGRLAEVLAMCVVGCAATPDVATPPSADASPPAAGAAPDPVPPPARRPGDPAPESRPGPEAPAPDPDAEHQRLNELLATKRLSLDFTDAPFFTIIEHIAQQAGVRIEIDPDVRASFEDADTRVNLQVDDITVGAALRILLDFTGLVYTFRNGGLYLTAPPADFDPEDAPPDRGR